MSTKGALKTMIWKSIKRAQSRFAKMRIPPPLLAPLARLFEDNHSWKTKYIEHPAVHCYFECKCTECGLIRHTDIIGDPFAKYFEENKTRKQVPFIRCEDYKFKKMLK